ncbi:MAG: DnaJ domain-containing protein [Micavibrio sp.]
MPRIQLKPNSPEFAENTRKPRTRACDMPGCRGHGDHRAPKDRSLSDHYWFCFDHVKDYNAAWDFFSGMNADEVEAQILKSLYGDRPTWRYDVDGAAAEAIKRAAWKTYHFTEEEPPQAEQRRSAISAQTPEGEALAIMGLEAPITLDAIKTRYKTLAKQYHPDLNKGDKKAEDLLKTINMAYTILKLSYAKFEKLDR